jgi:hypothetical protein
MTNKTASPAAQDFTGDEHWGKGGRYIIVDGKRVPALDPDTVATEEHVGDATGEPRTAVAGDTLTVQPAPKKGK